MKKQEAKLGATYQVKVSDKLTSVKLIETHAAGGWVGLNLKTNKRVRIKTAQRLRKLVAEAPTVAKPAKEVAKAAKVPASRNTGETAATQAKKTISLLDAAAQLLGGSAEPMSCQTMVNIALTQGLWAPKREGKTPANTLYSAILREIKTKGDDSRFVKVERGKFELAEK